MSDDMPGPSTKKAKSSSVKKLSEKMSMSKYTLPSGSTPMTSNVVKPTSWAVNQAQLKAIADFENALKAKISAPVAEEPVMKKTPAEQAKAAEAQFRKIINKAFVSAEEDIRRRHMEAYAKAAIRDAVNAKYGDMLRPADIERVANQAYHAIRFEIANIKMIPDSLRHKLADGLAKTFDIDNKDYTDEPNEDDDI